VPAIQTALTSQTNQYSQATLFLMNEPAQPIYIEPRWPVAITALTVLFLLTVLPWRIRVFPIWVSYIGVITLLLPMAALSLTNAKARLLRVERITSLLFCTIAEATTVAALARLLGAMVRGSREIGGNQLLTSSVAVWVMNVLTFSLLYWQIDRGGSASLAKHPRRDWLFPQDGVGEDALADWRATFVDYLYLAYSTATAFSSTDVLPLTSRAKVLMMLESAISLVTIVAVASRAINILGT
jgi:hypothetical protein